VKTLTWADPRTPIITLKYNDDNREATLAPLYRMHAHAVSQAMLKPGTMVTIEGYPSIQKRREMRAERIMVAGRSVELR
jgi:hypothetical protein